MLILVLLNLIAWYLPFRIDLTAEKRYSLSPATRKLLKEIEAPITIDVLLKGKFPAVFTKLKNSTADLLEEMQRYAGNKIQINFTDVNEWIPDAEKENIFIRFTDSLRQLGVPVDSLLQSRPNIKEEFKQQIIADTLKQLGIMPYNLQVQQKENEQTQRIIFPSAIVRLNNSVIPIQRVPSDGDEKWLRMGNSCLGKSESGISVLVRSASKTKR